MKISFNHENMDVKVNFTHHRAWDRDYRKGGVLYGLTYVGINVPIEPNWDINRRKEVYKHLKSSKEFRFELGSDDFSTFQLYLEILTAESVYELLDNIKIRLDDIIDFLKDICCKFNVEFTVQEMQPDDDLDCDSE